MIRTVYFDMDGVLTDLFSVILDAFECNDAEELLNGYTPQQLNNFLLSEVEYGNLFTRLPRANGFYRVIALIDDCIKERYRVSILSSLGGLGINGDGGLTVIKQKKTWLIQNLGVHRYNHMLAPKFVYECHEKASFANPQSLLIDDRSKNCDGFMRAGGHAYHYGHDRSESSIKALRGLLF